MAYIKQNVQGSYETTATDRNKSYLLALKSFLTSNGFEFISEDYSNVGQENIVLQIENMQYKFITSGLNTGMASFSIVLSKLLDDSTTKSVGNSINIQLTNLTGTIVEGTNSRPTNALSSTILFVKNKNSFILIIAASANNITLANNYVTGNIAYTLVDGTKGDIGFVCNGSINNNFTAIEKSQGNPVTFNVAHCKMNDDKLIYENKLPVNQSGMFVGDSDEVVGLVGAEKGKIYQTEKGKFLAFSADMGILMGDEI